jgi:hypothetical protein
MSWNLTVLFSNVIRTEFFSCDMSHAKEVATVEVSGRVVEGIETLVRAFGMLVPVIYVLASLARKTAKWFSSSTAPRRFIGVRSIHRIF